MKNRIFLLMLMLMLLLSIVSFPVSAQEAADLSRIGTITVKPRVENESINGEVVLYRVADMVLVHDGYDFTYTGDFADVNVQLDDLESPELAEALAVYAADHAVIGEVKSFENNAATFSATAGLYLVVHAGAQEGENSFDPFLVVFPGTDQNQIDYDVIACPKAGPVPDVPDEPTEPEPTEPRPTEPEPSLPQTGQLNWPVPLLAVAGMIMFVTGWILRFRDRKEDYVA